MYAPTETPDVMVQYSVTKDWRAKIRSTVVTLKESFPDFHELIYVTNQVIGPDADSLKTELRRSAGIWVDIRDQSWFTEREHTAPQREIASQDLIDRFVEPMLVDTGVRERAASPLTESEAKVALVLLTLEAADEATDKGLTRRCFESLVLSALRDTSAEQTLTAADVVGRVSSALPAGHEDQVAALTTGALSRLSKKNGPVKFISKVDAYHLSYSEQILLKDRTTSYLLAQRALEDQLLSTLSVSRPEQSPLSADTQRKTATVLRVGIETLLLRRGEAFATSVSTGDIAPAETEDIVEALRAAGASDADPSIAEMASAIEYTLERPDEFVRSHLRKLADAYTLFAFLRQTPDVQKAVVKIFSGGDIWLDTSVILPLLAETLLDNPSDRQFTVICRAALDAGVGLHVTDGVIEEVERHLNRSALCSDFQLTKWHGDPPFVFAAYMASGRSRADFKRWLETFRGASRPEEDVRQYLEARFGIDRRNLTDYSDPAPTRLRGIVQDAWASSHDRRRSQGRSDLDPGTISRLVAHDVENTVGVMELRKRDPDSPLGYTHWLLTLDRTAFRLTSKLRDEFGRDAPLSPALSPDFLVQILRIGPMRTAVDRGLRVDLPLLTDFSRLDYTPRELIDAADRARTDSAGVDEHVLQRRVRDRMDVLRVSYGPNAFQAGSSAKAVVLERLGEQTS